MTQPHLVFVGAHADDAEIWAGGVLALAATATIVIPRPDEMRSKEAEAGATVLGARCILLDEITDLRAALSELRPTVVVTHWFDDSHHDHRRIAEAVDQCVPDLKITTGLPLRMYCCDTYNSRGRTAAFTPTHAINIEQVVDQKLQAIAEHRSQPVDHFHEMVLRMSQAWAGRYGLRYAEVFMELPLLGVLSPSHAL